MADEGQELANLKLRREIAKLDVDIRNADANLKFERLKVWASLLGPIMTAVTILGTVYLGYLQIAAKSQSDEDAAWRDTLATLNTTPPEKFGEKHVATLLKPFLESGRYRELAIGVTIDGLAKIRDKGIFTDLFKESFPSPTAKDLPQILTVGRRLNDALTVLSKGADTFSEASLPAKSLEEAYILTSESEVVSAAISTALHASSRREVLGALAAGQQGADRLQLGGIYYENCDLSYLDLSHADFSNSTFDMVMLDGSRIDNITDSYSRLWKGAAWWRAASVDRDLLARLVRDYKPYQEMLFYNDKDELTASDWYVRIKQLCAARGLPCPDAAIQVKFPQPAAK